MPFAIATLLVRNHEVVALGISGANIVAMQQPMVGTRVSGPDSADEEQPDLPLDEIFDCRNTGIDCIAADLNPRQTDNYQFPRDCPCILVGKGKSLIATQLLI